MSNIDNRKFVGGEQQSPLLPIFKGPRAVFYPGQLACNRGSGSNSSRDRRGSNSQPYSALRRYVFRYENGTFVYLATRKGQRNGGRNIKDTQTAGVFLLTALGAQPAPVNENLNFSFAGKNISNEGIYTINSNSRIRYDSANTRWVWETRPGTIPPAPPSGPYYVTAFSASTPNTLLNSGTINEVAWTYVSYPFTTQAPQVPATVEIRASAWYNNNDVANLNKWPIKNKDADYGPVPPNIRKWQTREGSSDVIVPERRPACLTDSLLFKCFEGIPLKPYEIVFVEVVWKWFANKVSKNNRAMLNAGFDPTNGQWGYNVNDVEWWSPAPFKVQNQKGRIYRIGKLEADTGIGGYDTVTLAQRTRIITTKYTKGGHTALE
jgi:hypothetical protein